MQPKQGKGPTVLEDLRNKCPFPSHVIEEKRKPQGEGLAIKGQSGPQPLPAPVLLQWQQEACELSQALC